MKLSRDTWMGIGILLALVLVTSLAAIQQTRDENQAPYASTSSQPNGTLALKLWLNELGYKSAESPVSSFAPGPEVNTIFMIQPFILVTDEEWGAIDRWIDDGGVLVLAGRNSVTNIAMQHFEFNLSILQQQATEISPAVPLLQSPILESKVSVKAGFGISTGRTDFTPLMTAGGKATALTFQQEKGRVILSTTPEVFTNIALKDKAGARLILNLLAWTGPRGAVLFDEWHHGLQATDIAGLSQFLRNTPGGHAVLFGVFALFFALVLQGRSFGRPVPLRYEIKRRAPMEHVTAIANLNRKAGHRSEVARQYHHRLKRHLGQRYRLDPSVSDDVYVETLAGYNSAIDKDALLRLLNRLSQPTITEAELLKLSAEASKWMSE